MNYAEMSDFEINKAVALLCTIEGVVINDEGCPVRNVIDDTPGSYSGGDYIEFDFDPCNNPADAWPIIVENKIDLEFGNNTPHVDRWGYVDATCWKDGAEFEYYEKGGNPLRAAMVVFLMMKEGEGK